MSGSTSNPYISNGSIYIPTGGGGNLSINLSSGAMMLSSPSGASYTGNVVTAAASVTLGTGPVSVTFSSTGNDSISLSSGYLKGTVNFTPSGNGLEADVTGASIALNSSLPASAQISISDSSGSWQGTVSAGLKTGWSTLDNAATWKATFYPTKEDPCTQVPSAVASTCNMLEGSSKYSGTTSPSEQQQLDETELNNIGNINDLVDPTSSSSDTLLANNDQYGISYDGGGAYGSTGSTGGGSLGGTGGSGLGYAAVHGFKIHGTDIAGINSAPKSGTILPATSSISSSSLATLIGQIAGPTNQGYWGVGSLDGISLDGSKGAFVGIDANLNGGVYSTTASGSGGSFDTFNSSGTITSAIIAGSGESVSMNSGGVVVLANSSATITGSSDTVSLAPSSSATVSGSTEGINVNGGDSVSLTNGSGTINVYNSGNTITLSPLSSSAPADVIVFGTDVSDSVTNTTTLPQYVKAEGSGDTITATRETVELLPASSTISVNGSADTITASSSTINVSGSGNEVSGTGNTVNFTSTGSTISLTGTSTTIYANDDTIYLSLIASGAKVIGTGDTIVRSRVRAGASAHMEASLHTTRAASALVQAMAGYGAVTGGDSLLGNSMRPEYSGYLTSTAFQLHA